METPNPDFDRFKAIAEKFREAMEIREKVDELKRQAVPWPIGTCPSCGRCPQCGRSNHQPYPYYLMWR